MDSAPTAHTANTAPTASAAHTAATEQAARTGQTATAGHAGATAGPATAGRPDGASTRPATPAPDGASAPTAPAPPDPLFTAVDAPAFTARHLARLAGGTLAAVRVPHFLGPAECRAVREALDRLPTAPYDRGRVPTRVLRFGPALNDHRLPGGVLDADRYWAQADAARTAWDRAAVRPDAVAHAMDRIGEAWGAPVGPATIGGREAFGGTVREIETGLLMHFDDINREFPDGLFDQHVIGQLAFNLYVDVPSGGGATFVWRHRWEPADEEHREAYGYRPGAVAGCQRVELPPSLGDGLLFDPTHFHAVEPNRGGGRRIAFAFFLGITTGGRLVVWS
ncbi:2OG-Fe(II) oxygenase family protein [Streptomyces fradiae]|uniref:proline hydroxylase n=1 Tax=Streptomyces fradiae TaxID=1906 RepID=UPI003701B685